MHLPIIEIHLGVADRYNGDSYPKPGMYLVNGSDLIMVYDMPGVATQLTQTLPEQALRLLQEPLSSETLSMTNTVIDGDTLLKAIVLAQRPELAPQLLGGAT